MSLYKETSTSVEHKQPYLKSVISSRWKMIGSKKASILSLGGIASFADLLPVSHYPGSSAVVRDIFQATGVAVLSLPGVGFSCD